jgi:hypothetical protein
VFCGSFEGLAARRWDSTWETGCAALSRRQAAKHVRAVHGRYCSTDPGASTLKPYDIELQRLKAMRHDKGLIEVSIDALVMARKLKEDEAPSTCLRIPVDHARTLMLLLKQQFAALDKLQPRSRRSGRA